MFIGISILIFICNGRFSSPTPTVLPPVNSQYRERSVHTIVTNNHLAQILEKLGRPEIVVTTESSVTNTTSVLMNQTVIIPSFQTKRLPINPDVVAPDGSLVRHLLTTMGGSMAQFDLPPGMTSNAVEHRTVYEIWYFLAGQGEFWRKQNEREEIVSVDTDVCITIPVGTQFQFRTTGHTTLVAVAITMPPWPGDNEAIVRQGIWNASLVGIQSASRRSVTSIELVVNGLIFLIVKMLSNFD